MKISTWAVALSASAALFASGCRSDKSGEEGSGAEATDIPGAQSVDIESQAFDDSVQGGSLDSLGAGKSFRDRGYVPCTDVSFEPVYFGFDATAIRPEELGKVEAVAAHLAANPARVVSIEGNCDERGSNEYNMSLGEDRAIIIGNFLAQNGISRDRIETVSRGETNPAVEGSGESVWSRNRRGEFVIMQK